MFEKLLGLGTGSIGAGATAGGPLGLLAGSALGGSPASSSANSGSGDITGDFNFNSGSGSISDTGNIDLPKIFWLGAGVLGLAILYRAIKK
jgi:hypothetical protein